MVVKFGSGVGDAVRKGAAGSNTTGKRNLCDDGVPCVVADNQVIVRIILQFVSYQRPIDNPLSRLFRSDAVVRRNRTRRSPTPHRGDRGGGAERKIYQCAIAVSC